MEKPKIRFKDFNDIWILKILSNVTTYKNWKWYEDQQSDSWKYELVNLNSISIDWWLKHSGKYIDDWSDTLLKNDLVMILSDVWHWDLLWRVAVIPESNKFVLNQRVALLRIKDDTNPLFLFNCINSNQKYFKIAWAWASQLNISKSTVENFTFYVPDLPEQEKIWIIFENIDINIKINEAKLEKIKNLKQSFLQKMFPKEWKTVPEIRFKWFKLNWEREKLNNFLVVSKEKNSENCYWKNDVLSVSWEFWVVNQIEFQWRSFAWASVSNYWIVNKWNVVYTKSPLKSNPYWIIKSNKWKPWIVSVLYAVYNPKENCNPNFVQIYFEQNERLNNYLRPLISKWAKNTINVSDDDALKWFVTFPSKEEQDKICDFFDKFDLQINKQQEKVEKLKNIKQSLLEKMFI